MAPNYHATPAHINGVISKNLGGLNKPGVLTVRPGFEIADHMLTGRSAVVATVHTKKPKSGLTKNETLPDTLNGVPVDVREATAHQRLRAIDPAAAAVSYAYGRPEDREPEWPNEREMPSGKLLSDPKSNTQTQLKKARAAQPATDAALTKKVKKEPLDYKGPDPAVPLVRQAVRTTITTAISPDAGFATLQSFLEATEESLVIGMYDFTSGPVLSAFLKVLSAPKTLQMVLDNPAPNPTRDQTDWITVETLNEKLGSRSKITRALAGDDQFAAAKIFPTSYHIKVIVRDNKVLWLSSGNLNPSNEPDLSSPPHTEDRDWHVIVEDEALAQVFAAYIKNDYAVAAAHQAQDPGAVERAIEDAHAQKAREANPHPPQPAKPPVNPVAAKTFKDIELAITPLLTPDKLANGKPQYLTNIMSLIDAAQQTIDIELQYIEASTGKGTDYDKLLQALLDKSNTVRVQLIVSADYAEKNGEKMKGQGVDVTDLIRTYPSVHNKGFVVDGKTVIVSSQNFSPDGIELNRDAGLILESQPIAAYFGAAFDSDWKTSKQMTVKTRTSTATKAKARPAKAVKPKPKKAMKEKKAAKKAKKAKKAHG